MPPTVKLWLLWEGGLCQHSASELEPGWRKCHLGIRLTSSTGYSSQASPSRPSLQLSWGRFHLLYKHHMQNVQPTSRQDGGVSSESGDLDTATFEHMSCVRAPGTSARAPLPVEASLRRHWVSPGVLPGTLPGPESFLLALPLGLWGHSPAAGNKAMGGWAEVAHLLLGNNTTDPYIKRAFLFGGRQVREVSVLGGENSSCFLTLPLPDWRCHISCSWHTQEKNSQQSGELPPGRTPAP